MTLWEGESWKSDGRGNGGLGGRSSTYPAKPNAAKTRQVVVQILAVAALTTDGDVHCWQVLKAQHVDSGSKFYCNSLSTLLR